MKNISSWAIKNPVFPIVLFVGLTLMGIMAFIRMPINNNPDISFPFVQVQVSQPGAAPSEIETQIVKIIEPALANIQGVKNIQSRAGEGFSWTGIEFRIGTPIDRAVNDVRDAVSKVRGQLPDGIEEPSIERQDTDGGAISYYTVSTKNMTPVELSWFVDNIVSKKLQSVSGVATVPRSGGVDREIRINLDPQRLQAFGITAAEVNQQLKLLNLDAPGGRGEIGGAEQSIRILGGAKTAADLGSARITLNSGAAVRLSDIAAVSDGIAEKRSLSRFNGQEVTQFSVFKAKGFSEVDIGAKVDAKIAEILKENNDVVITKVYSQVPYTQEQYDSAIHAMLEGAFLAVIVVWFFLRDWRAMLITALAIPLSAIPAFWFMEMMGFTLNGISLLALSLVAGILVDDAIVEIENIVRHMRMGKNAYTASLEAADEIGLAVVATTAAIVAVFLPVGLMGGISGQFFKQFGLTIVFAVLMSLAVARLITPLLAAYFLKPHGQRSHGESKVMDKYLATLRWSLRNRWKTIAASILFMVSTGYLATKLPFEFQPPYDNGTTQVTIELTPGARVTDTGVISAEVSRLLRQQRTVKTVTEDITENKADLYISLVPRKEREETVQEFQRRVSPLLATIPDARINFQSQNGGFGRDFTLVLAGADSDLLKKTADKIIEEMRGLKVLRDPRIDGDIERPELIIKPKYDIAAEMGISVASLSQTIRIATMGDVTQNLAKFSAADRQIPIRVSLPESSRQNIATLENLPVPTNSGMAVPLKSVADISFGQGPTTIRRYNQSRRIVLGADFNDVKSSEAQAAVDKLPSLKNLPNGIEKVVVGEQEFVGELIVNFAIAVVTGILLVIGTLILLYRRVFQPFTNLGSLLLAPGGAFIALLITGYSISMPVLIGLLMLLGIVAKNSILLIDFAIEEMRVGQDRETAILEAAHKRAQPIVMTTIAMIAGMIPIAVGLTGDSSFRAPMAIAVIGGLATSTILTLLMVPAAFTLVDDIEKWLAPRFSKYMSKENDPVPAVDSAPQQHPAE
jgi:multidrug efflux pump subunit AcrB